MGPSTAQSKVSESNLPLSPLGQYKTKFLFYISVEHYSIVMTIYLTDFFFDDARKLKKYLLCSYTLIYLVHYFKISYYTLIFNVTLLSYLVYTVLSALSGVIINK